MAFSLLFCLKSQQPVVASLEGWCSSVHLLRYSIKDELFPAKIVIYHINDVWKVFMINSILLLYLMVFCKKKIGFSF